MIPYSAEEHDKIANDISGLYEELRREIELLAKMQDGGDNVPTRFPDPVNLNDIDRRLLIRSIFAFIEALSYSLKVLALSSNDAFRLEPGERMLAMEQAYELSMLGCVETRRAKVPTLGNVRFAFSLLSKVEGSDFRLDVSDQGWHLLQSSTKVRDRLMHPKALNDLLVSDEEIRGALRAFVWFEGQFVKILIATIRSLKGRVTGTKLSKGRGLAE